MGLIKSVITFVFKCLFFLFPVNSKKVFFSNFNGKGYSDNPRSIYEALKELHPDWKLIWWINNPNAKVPSDVKYVRNRISAMFALATSKVIVNNVKDLLPFVKKRKQFYLQTWHGGAGFKLVEKDAEEFLKKDYIKSSKKESRITDAVIADNAYQIEVFKRAFYYKDNIEILEYGCPRNDVFHHIDENRIKEFKKSIGVSEDSKIVIYVPTFRDDGDTSVYNLDFKRIIDAFNKDKKDNYVMLVRLHPNVPSDFKVNGEGKDVINVSRYPDAETIWISSDIMISDYSSVPFEFLEMNKIIYFYWPDYSEKIRLGKDFFNFGFEISKTEEELIESIKHFDKKEFDKVVSNYNSKMKLFNKGDASIKAAKKIESICLDKSWRSNNVR